MLEDATGKPLGPDPHVRLGDLVRVRLFLYSEHETPPFLAVRDRLGGGREPLDDAHETSPRESLWALLGMGPDADGDRVQVVSMSLSTAPRMRSSPNSNSSASS